MPFYTLRRAREADLPALLAIYSPYVLNTTVSFEIEPPSPEAFARRHAGREGVFPTLVCLDGARVIGYACAGPFASRAAYRWSAESSIYVDQNRLGGGAGRLLYAALIALLRAQGYRTLYALVTSPNPGSEAFHEALGFERQGFLPRAGFKQGRFVGVATYALNLNEAPPAAPPLTLAALGEARTDEIIEQTMKGVRP